VAKAITAGNIFWCHCLVSIGMLLCYQSNINCEEVLPERDAPAPSTVALIVTAIVTVMYVIIFFYVYRFRTQQFDLKKYIIHCLTSLSIAYTKHFIPFISQGFIQDPLKTAIITAGKLLLFICMHGSSGNCVLHQCQEPCCVSGCTSMDPIYQQ